MHKIVAESIDYQSNSNQWYIIDPEVSNDSKSVVEMDESNDSIDSVENQNDSTDDDDLLPVNIALNRLNEMTSVELIEGKSKTMPLNYKSPDKKRIKTTTETQIDWVVSTKDEKSPLKKMTSNLNKCTVCEYSTYQKGHFNRHMRTHTGEKPHRCDHCGRRFTNAESLVKHAATHIADFPFHCRACFKGFSLKAEVLAHEKCCRKRHYECHVCKKFFTCVKDELIRHMRIHTGDKPFRCGICMKHFGWKHDLKRHLNTIHTRINF